MTANLEAAVAELKMVASRLHEYNPTNESWQKAEKIALEVRHHVETLLYSTEGVIQLRSSGVLQEMKQLVPDVTREEVAELKVSDFVLGIIYEKPFETFDCVYRNFGTEYGKELSSEARKSSNLIKTSYVSGPKFVPDAKH